ncbi:hypothetical protein Hanom_Chr14g01270521 [Helianthus anomalus]
MNVFDLKAGGAMVVAILPEGKPLWLDQIWNNFLHPTAESMSAYANAVLGEDDVDDVDVESVPTREEVIVLSSEGSNESHEGVIHRSTRAGPSQGTVNEPVNEPTVDDVETLVDTTDQLETRKKKRGDQSEKKKAKEPVFEAPRKRPSKSSFMDYVVVSNTLSGLDAGDKRDERDLDDDTTLTEIAATTLAAEKSKLQKETTTAPPESEVDLGVFSAKPGNLLEQMYRSASGSRGPGKVDRKVDVSKITPPTSPPSRTFDMSPPHADLGGKRKEDDVEVEPVGEGGAGGGYGGVGGNEGVGGDANSEVESSEATPRHTIYTKRPPGSGGGGTSGVR